MLCTRIVTEQPTNINNQNYRTMYRKETLNGFSEYHYKGYSVGESSVFNRRTWCLSVCGNCIHFETLNDFKEWVDNRLKLFN